MDITQMISNLGFPIAVAVYMMYENKRLTETINELKVAIVELTTIVKEHKEHSEEE